MKKYIVSCYNIRYKDYDPWDASILKPREVTLKLEMPDDILDIIEKADSYIKEELEKKVELNVASFTWRVLSYDNA